MNIQQQYAEKLRLHIASLPHYEYLFVREQLAEVLGCSVGIINNMIYGRKYIDKANRTLICEFFNKNIFDND